LQYGISALIPTTDFEKKKQMDDIKTMPYGVCKLTPTMGMEKINFFMFLN